MNDPGRPRPPCPLGTHPLWPSCKAGKLYLNAAQIGSRYQGWRVIWPAARRKLPVLPRILIRLVTGASWVDDKAILDHQVSDTTLRARRDEWIAAGVSDRLEAEAHATFDNILGLDLSDVAVDGSLHKAP